jgi:hypothetical protein
MRDCTYSNSSCDPSPPILSKMPTASVLAGTNLIIPPVARNIFPSVSSIANNDFDEILPHTATPVSAAELQEFKTYLATIPFNFHDHQYIIAGRMLESEGDVRLFLEAAAVLPCWAVALSMVPASGRSFDLQLRSEKTWKGIAPDLSVFSSHANKTVSPLMAIEFKGPGALSVCENGIPSGDCDAWDRVTARLRKYACENGFKHIVVIDSAHALYFHFNEPANEHAEVTYILASVGDSMVNFTPTVTARELMLFAFFTCIGEISQRRLVPFARLRYLISEDS